MMPAPEVLRRIIQYDPDTGVLTWLARDARMFSGNGNGGASGQAARWNGQYAGKIAFPSIDQKGYHSGMLLRSCVLAHRVAWALHTMEAPPEFLDHINGDRSDNRIENLRPATKAENARNSGKKVNNTSGFKGVCKSSVAGKWRARISVDGKRIRLGNFLTKEDAFQAYEDACRRMHGDFARTE